MSVKFFGQFLIEQGEVDAGHVREALDLLGRTNRSLGEVAVDAGMMSNDDVERVSRAQRGNDRPFGDLAVELDMLTSEQLVECLRLQAESRLKIGEALVHLGHLPAERLGQLLDAFKVDQAAYELGPLAQLPDPLANNRVAPYVLDLLPKFCMRMGRINVKVGDAQVLGEAPAWPIRISLPVHAHRGLDVTLVGDRDFCARLASGTSGIPEPKLDHDLVMDGVGEFLNVLAGNAISALERSGVQAELGIPDHDAELADGWIFDLATSVGRGALVLMQF
jgi:hypothetical protein